MVMIHIDDDGQFSEALNNAGSRLVVCDFFAHWCRPCQFIEPRIESLSTKYSEAIFLKVDVDQCHSNSCILLIKINNEF